MAETEKDTRPAGAQVLLDVLHAARGGWVPGKIGLAWLGMLPVYLILRAGDDVALTAVGMVCAALVLLAVSLMLCGTAGWEYGRGGRWDLGVALSLLRARLGTLLLAVLSVVLVPAVFWAIILLGSLALGRIPAVGPILASIWLVLAGIPLGLVGTVYGVLAVPASLLMIPAAALDFPDAFDVASRSISYVRSRPLKFGVLLVTALVGSLGAAIVTGLTVTLLALALVLAFQLGSPSGLQKVRGGERAVVERTFEALDLSATPAFVLAGIEDTSDPDTTGATEPSSGGGDLPSRIDDRLPGLLELVLAALGRVVDASFLAAFAVALSRIYLNLRWELDLEPPSALVKHDESFRWAEASP